MNTLKFSFIFFLFLTKSLLAQELFFTPSKAFQNISSLETYYVFQDSKGLIWVATDAGVNCYDGNSVTCYTTKDGLAENVVFKIYEDAKGRIWFSTLSGLLCYYENYNFHSIAANPELKRRGRSFAQHSFFIGEKDTLYFFSSGFGGILKIPPQNNYKTVIPYCTNEIQGSYFSVITNPIKPTEGIIAHSPLYEYSFDELTHLITWNNKKYNITYQAVGIYVNSWRITFNNQADILYVPYGLDLSVINKNNSAIRNYRFNKEIIYLYYDKEGDLWVLCKRGGGYLYKNADLTSKPIHFLNQLSVSSVRIDREGTIWATTLEKGVFTCNSKNILTVPNQENDQITNLQVDTNRLIVPHFSKKLISFFKNDSVLMDTIKCVYTPEHYIYSYYQGEDYFYFHKYGGYLSYVSQQKNKTSIPVALSSNMIREFVNYREDTVITLATTGIMICCREKKIAKLRSAFSLNCIIKLHDGRILLGCRDGNGILELKNRMFIFYQPQLYQLRVRINVIVEDKRNRLWLATEDGLMCLDEKQVLHDYKKNKDALSLKMTALTVDEENNVWCSNGSSLIRIQAHNDLTHPSITTFNTCHGLPDTRIEKLAAFDSKIYCVTKGYLFYFKNNSLKKNLQPPLTQLKSIYINGIKYPLSDTITVAHDQNNITIEATSSTYKSNEPKVFLYRLDGYDSKWQSLNKGNIQYTNLDHGTYKLSVYSLNNDGVKGPPVSFTLVIKRPFWFTWWFITFIIILLIILIAICARYWKARIEKKERDKATINQQLAEFKMTALRSQMNPHFIYNAIGSIQHYILKNDIDQSFNYLSKFSSLIRKILNNSRNEFISLEQEISTLQLYIELEQIRFKHPFKFVLTIDDKLDMETDIPTMLIQPYIENSIWHGLMPKETEGRLELTLKKGYSAIHVSIKDNGVGREKADLAKKNHLSKGMSLTEQRIQTLENTSNKKFVTLINDLEDETGNPIGTEVNLIIPFDE